MTADVSAKTISYEEAKELASDADPEVRRALAQRTDLSPEMLYFLAGDVSEDVRKSVASNQAAPRHTYPLLVEDESGAVRGDLAKKIAKLAPDLPPDDQGKLWQIANDALTALAKDQMVHVRQIMAEALKNVTTVPPDVIRILAHDIEASVASPVLEFSPILSDDDLLDIIQQGAASDNLSAISRRETVSHGVSDAIVGTDDTHAIAELLSNSSAQIREETLDDLIDRAADIDIWHEPLVHRPSLPPKAPQKLAMFIADSLIAALENRDDLDAETLGEIKQLVKERLDDEGGEKAAHAGLFDFLEGPLPMVLVNRLHTSGGLNAAVFLSAVQAEDHRFVLAGLVALSGLNEQVAKRIFAERNPKGIVSLIWKANLPAYLIVPVQQRMARVAPDDMIQPKGEGDVKEDQEFPLTQKEMEWNIQFFSELSDHDPEQ